MANWCYWENAAYYQQELKQRALGRLPEMESARYLADLVAQDYNAGDAILDVGCGTGHYLLSLERRLESAFEYTGVDITPQHIADAREVFSGKSNCVFQTGDVRALPFENDQFDITICANTIPHIPNAEKALAELIRVTRKLLLVRMLVGNEIYITKKAYSERLNAEGEPIDFGYVNIYTEAFVARALGVDPSRISFLPDCFDPERIAEHFSRHVAVGGPQRATRLVDGYQVKGYLLLPWKVVKTLKR